MPKELKLILRNQPIGLPPTPKQSEHREKFAKASKEAADSMRDNPALFKLDGAARVMAFNRLVSEILLKARE